MTGYFSDEELIELGFGAIGNNVKISKNATLYNRENVFIGNNVRIDNFCVIAVSLNAKLIIGNNIHISAFNFINGLCDVILEEFVTLAPYVRIFTSTDDYSGVYMTGATLPKCFLGTVSKPVYIRKHTIIGTGSTIMPGVDIKEGTAIGAHSFVNKNTKPYSIVAGVPAKFIKERSRALIALEMEFNRNKNES